MGRGNTCFTLDLALLRKSVQTQEFDISGGRYRRLWFNKKKKERKKTCAAISPRVGGRGSVHGGI